MRDAKSEIKEEILMKMFGLIGPAQRAQLEEAIVVVLNRYAETYVFLQELESEVAFVSHTKASG